MDDFILRSVILIVTISTLLAMAQKPADPPHKDTGTPYCVVDQHVAGKDQAGNWHSAWVEGYGPCSTQDRYRFV